ncbi:MAG TPA: MBL fold metallo-hydrolase [Pyrinomonadaceae bacterium]|nr:MBL fold metallo-hydrolase [Pyrinomonadaceae bacterium]
MKNLNPTVLATAVAACLAIQSAGAQEQQQQRKFVDLYDGPEKAAANAAHARASRTSRAKEATGVAANFEVQKLAEGVYAVIRKDLPGMMVDANNVFIINDEDVIVVDTSGAPAITKEVLAALRKLTNKPVRYVINTHWHDDHIRGDKVYREAFPAVEFIAHAATRDYLPTKGVSARKQFLEGAPKFVDFLRSLLEKNKSIGGWDLTEEERASMASDIRLADFVLGQAPQTEVILPTLTLEDRLTLRRGNRIIDVRYLGRGHTSGDIVVHLPKEGIVITGDLVVWPVPFIGSDQSHIGDWATSLERLRALRPAIIVPGHGPVLRDDSYVKLIADMFASIKEQTEAAVSRGETLEQTRKIVRIDEFRKQITGDSRLRSVIFNMYVAGPAVEAAFNDASAKR